MSPHRNIKAKVRPLPSGSSAGGNRSVIFDGLEDDDLHNVSSGGGANKSVDLFVPRKSVKKLVLKPKSPATPRGVGTNLNETANTTANAASPENTVTSPAAAAGGDESLHLPTVRYGFILVNRNELLYRVFKSFKG